MIWMHALHAEHEGWVSFADRFSGDRLVDLQEGFEKIFKVDDMNTHLSGGFTRFHVLDRCCRRDSED